MSRFDEHLFGRLAIYNRILTKDQLVECLALQRVQGPDERQQIGEILLERGYITRAQLELILDIRRKKLRKMLLDSRELVRTERSFGRLAVKEGLLRPEELEVALLEQQRLRRMNLQLCLGDIMVSLGFLDVPGVLKVLALQDGRILCCPDCDSHFTVFSYDAGTRYTCRHCKGVLREPSFLDTVATDGTIGDQDLEESVQESTA